jgi:multidrug efflux pump subunit AcrB
MPNIPNIPDARYTFDFVAFPKMLFDKKSGGALIAAIIDKKGEIIARMMNDVYMQISLVMLIGLAAKNAILVVEYADKIHKEEGLSLKDAAIEAARLRIRPILMTAFAFVLGVMPLAFADGVYSTARNIIGVALLGGMLAATLVGVFLYPALYYLIARLSGENHKQITIQ